MGRDRQIVLTAHYLRRAYDLGVRRGTDVSREAGRLVRELAKADELPLPGDVEAPLPRTEGALAQGSDGRQLLTAFVRRVKGRPLWVWYRVTSTLVQLVTVTKDPPPR